MTKKVTTKKTVRRPARTQAVDAGDMPIPTAPTIAEMEDKGAPEEEEAPTGMQVPMAFAQNRLLQKLIMAEKEAADNGACMDQLSGEVAVLKKQNRQLTEALRAAETALFEKDNEAAQEADGDSGENKGDE